MINYKDKYLKYKKKYINLKKQQGGFFDTDIFECDVSIENNIRVCDKGKHICYKFEGDYKILNNNRDNIKYIECDNSFVMSGLVNCGYNNNEKELYLNESKYKPEFFCIEIEKLNQIKDNFLLFDKFNKVQGANSFNTKIKDIMTQINIIKFYLVDNKDYIKLHFFTFLANNTAFIEDFNDFIEDELKKKETNIYHYKEELNEFLNILNNISNILFSIIYSKLYINDFEDYIKSIFNLKTIFSINNLVISDNKLDNKIDINDDALNGMGLIENPIDPKKFGFRNDANSCWFDSTLWALFCCVDLNNIKYPLYKYFEKNLKDEYKKEFLLLIKSFYVKNHNYDLRNEYLKKYYKFFNVPYGKFGTTDIAFHKLFIGLLKNGLTVKTYNSSDKNVNTTDFSKGSDIIFKQIRYGRYYNKKLELKNGNILFDNFTVADFTEIGVTSHFGVHYVSAAMFKKNKWYWYNDMGSPIINQDDQYIKDGNEINIFYIKNDLFHKK